ncbi:MAG TPA: sugar phosphate nucleotidyltransferase [Ignavibacteria bacterium]|nr:UDP-N-acetylglucosamine pyrophosphorylase [Bacteroidota bacterium]HRE11312.1 sugar phosphate nucleotidyltransferase [Ignavibacteria bacterium]HRF65668.1 sugar phosphate nucleotidyltransferase [Ignavibacteria bacterium]HRJ03300.1 sugar phosphate nucleotidyltransferase [Ignavibacteria bacterium]
MPITDTDFNNKKSAFLENKLAELMKKVKDTEGDMNEKLAVAILAAGLGKRMKSPDKPKVMFEINSRPMIDYVVELAFRVNADLVVPIVGHHREQVINFLDGKFPGKEIKYAVQAEQLGTGHAVIQTAELLKDFDGEILILSGDVPLLKFETVERLINEHFSAGNDATLLTTVFENSYGYGRIVRDSEGNFTGIVEEKDATEEQKQIKEINPAIYIVNSKVLFDALSKISPENNQKEYYLTDIFRFIPKEKTGTVVTNDELEVTGVNSIEQLKEMEDSLNSRA